jgi:hypothetical protein
LAALAIRCNVLSIVLGANLNRCWISCTSPARLMLLTPLEVASVST